MRAIGAVLSAVLSLPIAATPVLALDAFPGAEGFGRVSQGGRGGAIIKVSNLNDSGRGSLRACIDAKRPRVCVFTVGGIIRFTTAPPIIRNPYITIAGQTAPGGGILLTHNGGAQGFTPLVTKGTHDVIIRDIRVRTDKNGLNRGSNDAITIEDSENVIVDHVSTSWALDENINGWAANQNITISNSIFAEGVPRHDKCALLGGHTVGPQNLSFVKNLCAHNGDRNPDANFKPGSCINIVNNVFYNAQSQFVEIWESEGATPVNIVNNYFKAGPNSQGDIAAIDRQTIGSVGVSKIYYSGNQLDGVFRMVSDPVLEATVKAPVCAYRTPLSAAQAYSQVLQESGAFPRDSFDEGIVNQVKRRTGRIIGRDAPRVLPVIASGTPYRDSDNDGMSDAWERARGLNIGRNDAWAGAGNGWTNMDLFLDYAHRQAMAGRPVQ